MEVLQAQFEKTREMCEMQILEFSIWRHISQFNNPGPRTRLWGKNGGILVQFYEFRQGLEN